MMPISNDSWQAGYGMGDPDLIDPEISGASSGAAAFEEQQNPGGFVNWITGKDPTGHNESLYAYQREQAAAKEAFEREANFNAAEAQKNRDWQEMMSNTAFQRQVADLKAAGFSELAALGSATGAPVGSGSSASASGHQASSAASRGPSANMAGVLGALITSIALIASKGIGAAAKAASSSGAAAAAASKAVSAASVGSKADVANRWAWDQHLKRGLAFKAKYGHFPDDF